VGFGDSCRRQQGGRKPSLLLSLKGGRGQAGFVMVWLGRARSVPVTVADGSTGEFAPLRCSLWRVDMVGSGQMRLGRLGIGWVRLGKVIAADGSKEGVSLPCCSLRRADKARPGGSRRGRVRTALVWQGESGRFGAPPQSAIFVLQNTTKPLQELVGSVL